MSKVIGMRLFTTAVLEWFGDGCCDVKFLDIWNDTPRTYLSSQANDSRWQTDHYEALLSANCDQEQFQKAADLLMGYRFYPPSILTALGDFNLADERWLTVGDRIVQRIHVIRLLGKPILDLLSMAEVSQAITEPRHCGFTCVTVAPNVVQGEWSACITWRENSDLVLKVDTQFRPSPQEPAYNRALMGHLMQKAHRSGVTHFKQLL